HALAPELPMRPGRHRKVLANPVEYLASTCSVSITCAIGLDSGDGRLVARTGRADTCATAGQYQIPSGFGAPLPVTALGLEARSIFTDLGAIGRDPLSAHLLRVAVMAGDRRRAVDRPAGRARVQVESCAGAARSTELQLARKTAVQCDTVNRQYRKWVRGNLDARAVVTLSRVNVAGFGRVVRPRDRVNRRPRANVAPLCHRAYPNRAFPERINQAQRPAIDVTVPVPRLRIARVHRGEPRRVGGPPAAEGGAVIAHQEIVLPGDDVLLLAGEAAVAASRGERLPVRRVADRAPNRVRWG